MNFYFEHEDYLKDDADIAPARLDPEYIERDMDLREIYEISRTTTVLENFNY